MEMLQYAIYGVLRPFLQESLSSRNWQQGNHPGLEHTKKGSQSRPIVRIHGRHELSIEQKLKTVGRSGNPGRHGGVLCVETGFYADHFLGIKMHHWIKCLSSLLSDFVSFWSNLSTPNQGDAWKKLKLPKAGKGCLKLRFFLWFTHWCNRLCETNWLGVSKDIKEILKFYKNELRL